MYATDGRTFLNRSTVACSVGGSVPLEGGSGVVCAALGVVDTTSHPQAVASHRPAMLSVRKSRRPLILVTATCQSYLERAASETNVGDSLRLIDSSADQHDTEPDLQGQLYRIHLAPSWMARHHYTAVSPRPTLAWAPHAPPCLLPHLDAGFMGWLLKRFS